MIKHTAKCYCCNHCSRWRLLQPRLLLLACKDLLQEQGWAAARRTCLPASAPQPMLLHALLGCGSSSSSGSRTTDDCTNGRPLVVVRGAYYLAHI